MRTLTAIATIVIAFASGAVLAQNAPAPPTPAPKAARPPPTPATGEVTKIPANLAPRRIQSAALNVTDLAAQRAWYETALGMTLVRTIGANEIVLSMDPGNPNASNVVLQRANRQPGATTYGRLILNVADAKATADFLQTHGVTMRTVIPNQAYFFNDPEGNVLEIYQPSPPAPPAAR